MICPVGSRGSDSPNRIESSRFASKHRARRRVNEVKEEEAEFAIFESERNEHGICIGNDREMVSHSVGDTVSAECQHVVTTSWCDEKDN